MFNFKQNEKYRTIAVYAALVIIVSALVILAVINFSAVAAFAKKIAAVLSPFTYGFVFAYLANPILNFYERTVFSFKKSKKNRHTLRRALSLILTVITALAIIAVIAWAVIPQTIKSVNDFGSQFNSYISNLQEIADELTVKYSDMLFGESYSSFTELLSDHDISFNLKQILSGSFSLFKDGFDHIISAGGKIVGSVINVLMGIFLMIYFLASKEKICAQTKKLLASLQSRRTYINTIRLARYTHKTFGGFIVGKLIDSAIIGLISFVVLWIFKMPYYPLLAVIIGVTNVVPTFGPIVGGLIGGFIVLISSPEDLLLFVIFAVLIQQLDGNFIGPTILGDSIGIGALWVMIAVIFFGGFFGFTGMVLGVPAIAVLYSLTKQASERRLKKKNMPISTAFYANDPPQDRICSDSIFVEKDEPVPEVTSADDLPEKHIKKKPTLTERIKNNIESKKSKGKQK